MTAQYRRIDGKRLVSAAALVIALAPVLAGPAAAQYGYGPCPTPSPAQFFTAGPGGEQHGLFGRLGAVN